MKGTKKSHRTGNDERIKTALKPTIELTIPVQNEGFEPTSSSTWPNGPYYIDITHTVSNLPSVSGVLLLRPVSTMTTGMTLPNSKPPRRVRDGTASSTRGPRGNTIVNSLNPEITARMMLFVACLWPLWLLALFGASAPRHDGTPNLTRGSDGTTHGVTHSSPGAVVSNSRFNLRSVLDRVDVMGYGPTHPRLAVVIVGDEKDQLVSSVESVYSHTDINRIFVICAVLDGHSEDPALVQTLQTIDSGSK